MGHWEAYPFNEEGSFAAWQLKIADPGADQHSP
jgi:hypothetical protein